MTALITLTTAGADTGPFNLYSDLDGYITPFEIGVSKAALLAGYSTSLIPDFTTTVRILSTSPYCVNFVDVSLFPPLDFVLTSSCGGINATLSMTTYTGGSGSYESGNGFFLSEVAALANTSWVAGTAFGIGIGSTPGTYWMVIRDSLGTLKAKSVVVNCSNAYLLSRCNDGDPYVVAQTYPFVVGEVIQFQVGVPGAGTVYCGTIDAYYIGTPDAEIYSGTAYSCGDGINCI